QITSMMPNYITPYHLLVALPIFQQPFTKLLTVCARHSIRYSPGKSTAFPSTSPPHLLCNTFGSKNFVLFGRLIQYFLALYEVRVPRGGSLPPTSFRLDGHPPCPCLKLQLLLPSLFGTFTL